ncbi:MAG: response regulator [Pseudomonadota bacterium]
MDREFREHYAAAPGDVLGAMFSLAPVLALALDRTGRVERASRALLTLLGLEAADLEGVPLAEAMPPDHAQVFKDGVLPVMIEHGRVRRTEISLLDSRGVPVPLCLEGFVELGPDGVLLRIYAVLEDLRETRDALEALDQKAAEAEEASNAKSRFLAAMSHEIRTPMNAIMGFAQLLQLSDLDETRQGHVKAIISAGNAMVGLLTDLLDLSQVEAGQMRIEPRAFDLHAMLADIERWWRDSAAEKGLAFSVTLAENLPVTVVSDVVRIQQVLNNYLANAVKFTLEGKVELEASVLREELGGMTLRFRVSDTGPGIAPEHVARLYRPFVRIEGEGRGPRTGWGLGLSICANIAEAMGADVGVDSEAGEGATFWLDVPVQRPPDAPADSADHAEGRDPVSPRPASPSQRVLLVEDNALNQEVMRRMLEDMGHAVTQVTNGFAALEILEGTPFDVVVMDVMMPGLGGIATTKRLREAGHGQSDVPIVACSAHVSAEDERRYHEIGMTSFLPKPVDRQDLARAIDEAVAHQTSNA